MKVRIACPAHTITGGPEALHQLLHALRGLGVDAKIVYNFKESEATGSPTAPPFRIYDVAIADTIEDEPDVLVVVSEMQTELLQRFRRARKAIWWLSVDNYHVGVERSRLRRKWWHFRTPRPFNVDRPQPGVVHLVQSEYARRFVADKQLGRAFMLTDYLRDDFLEGLQGGPAVERLPQVAYNPKKGLELTQHIAERADQRLKFVRIENMKPAEVVHLLRSSAVYMDFGHHPGRDRIPREAAVCGCCIVTGRRGSAANDVDLPIPGEFKLDEASPTFVDDAVAALTRLTDGYAEFSPSFETYRTIIRDQRRLFDDEVRAFVAAFDA